MRKSLIAAALLALASPAQPSAAAATPAKPALMPPMENGVYVAKGVCFGEGYCYSNWRANKIVQLRARPDPAAPIVATVKPKQWVEAVDGQLRLVPLRGVVRKTIASPPMKKGDVVYMLEPQGEGFYMLWHKGRTVEHDWASGDPNEPIDWDKHAAPPNGAITGWWVQLKTKNGKMGWVKDPSFECMGQLAGDANCRD
jgi:hypothetical protein